MDDKGHSVCLGTQILCSQTSEEVVPTGFFLSPRLSSADLQNSLAVLSQAGPMAAASSEATTRLRVTRLALVSDRRPCNEHICQRTVSCRKC